MLVLGTKMCACICGCISDWEITALENKATLLGNLEKHIVSPSLLLRVSLQIMRSFLEIIKS